MRTHRKTSGTFVAALGMAVSLLLLATCESPLLEEIREANALATSSEEPIVYSVTFDNQGADVPAEPEIMTVTPPARTLGSLPTEPQKDGLSFDGWWTAPNRRGTEFVGSTIVDADITVYAFWYDDSDVYEVTFDRAGGSGGTSSVNATYGRPMPSATAPTKGGYRFDGYFTLSNGGGDQYYTGDMESARNWDIQAPTQLIANWGVYEIGDTGPAGGIVFYDKGEYTNGWRYLEAAPASTEWTNRPWGGIGTLVGGTETAIGTGKANTQAIVTEYGDEEPRHGRADYAAKLCADLEYGGKTDWFLPSMDELQEMYLRRGLIGGFSSDTYWSSTENTNADQAWGRTFGTGPWWASSKSLGFSVRAARAF